MENFEEIPEIWIMGGFGIGTWMGMGIGMFLFFILRCLKERRHQPMVGPERRIFTIMIGFTALAWDGRRTGGVISNHNALGLMHKQLRRES